MRERTACLDDCEDSRGTGHLTPLELADRWRISVRTLEKWRQLRIGPRYLRVGGCVRYSLIEVAAYEAAQLRGRA